MRGGWSMKLMGGILSSLKTALRRPPNDEYGPPTGMAKLEERLPPSAKRGHLPDRTGEEEEKRRAGSPSH